MKNPIFLLKLIILGLGIYAFTGCKETPAGDDGDDKSRDTIPNISSDTTGPKETDTIPNISSVVLTDTTVAPETNVLYGIVLDNNQAPIRRAKVKVRGKQQSTVTDKLGYFKIVVTRSDKLEITPEGGPTYIRPQAKWIVLPTSDDPEELPIETSEYPPESQKKRTIELPPNPDDDKDDKPVPPEPVIKDPVLQIDYVKVSKDYILLSKDQNDKNSYNYTIEKRTNGQIVNSGQIDERLYFKNLGLEDEVQYVIKITALSGKPTTKTFSMLNGRLDPKCTAKK